MSRARVNGPEMISGVNAAVKTWYTKEQIQAWVPDKDKLLKVLEQIKKKEKRDPSSAS